MATSGEETVRKLNKATKDNLLKLKQFQNGAKRTFDGAVPKKATGERFAFKKNGKCNRGDRCKFQHVAGVQDAAAVPVPSKEMKAVPPPPSPTRGEDCFQYKRDGRCRFGDKCKKHHVALDQIGLNVCKKPICVKTNDGHIEKSCPMKNACWECGAAGKMWADRDHASGCSKKRLND